MNTSKYIVRMDPLKRTAELEIMTPHGYPRLDGLEVALAGIGIRSVYTVELSTPRYRVTRSKLADASGASLEGARVVEILRVAKEPRRTSATWRRCAA